MDRATKRAFDRKVQGMIQKHAGLTVTETWNPDGSVSRKVTIDESNPADGELLLQMLDLSPAETEELMNKAQGDGKVPPGPGAAGATAEQAPATQVDDQKDIKDRVQTGKKKVTADDQDPLFSTEEFESKPPLNLIVKTTYEIITPESAEAGDAEERGWIDEEGETFESVEDVVRFLQDNGANESSSSSFNPGVWYTHYGDYDYSTRQMERGEIENRSYHLYNFTPEQEEEVFNQMTGKKVAVKKTAALQINDHVEIEINENNFDAGGPGGKEELQDHQEAFNGIEGIIVEINGDQAVIENDNRVERLEVELGWLKKTAGDTDYADRLDDAIAEINIMAGEHGGTIVEDTGLVKETADKYNISFEDLMAEVGNLSPAGLEAMKKKAVMNDADMDDFLMKAYSEGKITVCNLGNGGEPMSDPKLFDSWDEAVAHATKQSEYNSGWMYFVSDGDRMESFRYGKTAMLKKAFQVGDTVETSKGRTGKIVEMRPAGVGQWEYDIKFEDPEDAGSYMGDDLKKVGMKKKAGYSLRDGDKSEIADIYPSLKLVSTSEENFQKPSFGKINDKISVMDNGSVTVFIGEDTSGVTGEWYELEGAPESLYDKTAMKKKAADIKTMDDLFGEFEKSEEYKRTHLFRMNNNEELSFEEVSKLIGDNKITSEYFPIFTYEKTAMNKMAGLQPGDRVKIIGDPENRTGSQGKEGVVVRMDEAATDHPIVQLDGEDTEWAWRPEEVQKIAMNRKAEESFNSGDRVNNPELGDGTVDMMQTVDGTLFALVWFDKFGGPSTYPNQMPTSIVPRQLTKIGMKKKAESAAKYLEVFFEEKQLTPQSWEIEGNDGMTHFIDSDVVIEAIMGAPPEEQEQIANTIRKIDFVNGDVNDFLKHLATALVNGGQPQTASLTRRGPAPEIELGILFEAP